MNSTSGGSSETRRERLAGHPDRLAAADRGDHGDAGGEPARARRGTGGRGRPPRGRRVDGVSSPGRNSKSNSVAEPGARSARGCGQVSRASGLIPSGTSPSGMRSGHRRSPPCTVVMRHRRRSRDPSRRRPCDSRATQRASSTVQALGAELDVEPAGRPHVERDHLVVHVPAQRRRQRRLVLAHPLQRAADVVELVDLEHDVHALATGSASAGTPARGAAG